MRVVAVKRLFGFDLLIRLLAVFLLISAAYSGYYTFQLKDSFFEKKFSQARRGGDISSLLLESKIKDYSSFLGLISKRDIFALSRRDSPSEPKVDRQKINKVIENLRLVGIKSGDSNRVIIEDKQNRKTFYLKQGDVFLDNIKVDKIGKDSVILNFYGEDFELYL